MRQSSERISRGRSTGYWLLALVFLFQCGRATAASQEEADALFQEGQWEAAADSFETLLDSDPSNGSNWFRLARSYEGLDEFEKANDAYSNALNNGYRPPGRARYSMARMLMRLGDENAALALLEDIATAGGPSYRTVQGAPEFQPLADNPRFQAVIKMLKPCTSDAHRNFDFWLGTWDVTPAGTNSPTASNEISLSQDGCVVLENYVAGGFTGMSINFYDATIGKWHQTWMSNAGGALYLEGGLREDGAMEMTDRDLPSSAAAGSINKTVWTPMPDGSVRQVWTNSSDAGKNWTVIFDGIYRRQSDD